MTALAQALQLLQYAKPQDSTNPSRTQFIYGVSVNTLSSSGSCVAASYTVQFTAMPLQGANRWQVQVSPGSYVPALPKPGASPQWP
jgi:hypothetical protein